MSMIGSKGKHHHHRAGEAQQSSATANTGTTNLNSQLQTAVVNAIQNYDASSGTPSGLMTAIQNAINTTLQNNGITPPGTGRPGNPCASPRRGRFTRTTPPWATSPDTEFRGQDEGAQFVL